MSSLKLGKRLDPRTRAQIHDEVDTTERATLLQPFWKPMHANAPVVQQISGFFEIDTGTIEGSKYLDQLNQELLSLKKWDQFAYWTSWISFGLWFFAMVWHIKTPFGFELWENELLFTRADNSSLLSQSYSLYQESLTTHYSTTECKKHDWFHAELCREFDKKPTFILSTSRKIWLSEDIPAFWLLTPVIWITLYYQYYRYNKNTAKYDVENKYMPVKPNFDRWLEYALTSPFQIVIVAGTLLIGDIHLLTCLFFLQLGLIWFGFFLEKMINRIYKGKKSEDPNRRENVSDNRAYIVLFVAWSIFCCIWGILFYKMAEYQKQLTTCSKNGDTNNGIPGFVWAVVLGQFFSFLSFGIVQTWQLFTAQLQNSKVESMPKWINVSKFYSILSVSSKTILDITLLAFIINAQSMQCSSDAKFSTVQPWPAVQNAYFHSSNVSCT